MNAQLPPRGPDDPDDLPDDAELKALYDRLPPSEPSSALDATVLRAAAAAVASPVTHRRPRWPLVVATAATVVLAGGLAWRMRNEPAAPTGSPASPAARIAPTATEVRTSPQDQASNLIRQASPSLAGHPLAAKREVGALKATSDAAPAPSSHRSAAPRLMQVPPPPPPAPMAPPEPMIPAVAEAPPAPPAPPSPPAPSPYAPLTAPAPNAAADRADMRETVSTASIREFARIRRLFQRGETEQALAALKAFHQAHPDQALPPDLRDRLAKP
jgi:hypothetical protein